MWSFIRRINQKLSRDYKWSFLIRQNFEPDANYFNEVYGKKLFGNSDSASGPGSSLEATRAIRHEIPQLLSDYGIKSIADIPCGDLSWISRVDLNNIDYSGFDIVPSLISTLREKYSQYHFNIFEATKCIPPKKDLILCRDLLVHLTTQQAIRVIDNFRKSGTTYLAATTFIALEKNTGLVVPKVGVGWRPLNLAIEPFNLGPTLTVISEQSSEGFSNYKDKSLGVWRLN